MTKISQRKKSFIRKSLEKYKSRKIYPIIGPDGVGKTTLLTSAIDIKKKIFFIKDLKKLLDVLLFII